MRRKCREFAESLRVENRAPEGKFSILLSHRNQRSQILGEDCSPFLFAAFSPLFQLQYLHKVIHEADTGGRVKCFNFRIYFQSDSNNGREGVGRYDISFGFCLVVVFFLLTKKYKGPAG